MFKRTPIEKRVFLRAASRTYHFWGYDYAGKQYERTTHQTERKAAIAAAREIEQRLSVPPPNQTSDQAQASAADAFTLGQAISLLEAHDVRVRAAKNTVAFHATHSRHLLRLLKADHKIEPKTLTLAVLQTHTDKRLAEGASHHHVQKDHRVLRHALRLAKDIGMYTGDPKTLTVEGFRTQNGVRGFYKPGDRWLEKSEYVDALIAHTSSNPDQHRVDRKDDILTIVNTGLRRRELLVICPEHADVAKAALEITELKRNGTVERALKTEGAKRTLPLTPVMCAMFERRKRNVRAGTPLFTEWGSGNRDLRANWRRAREWLLDQAKTPEARADLDATLPTTLNFNDLRRTFCSRAREAGVSFEDCADLLGHEDISMVRLVYAKTSITRLHEAVAKLPAMELHPETVRVAKVSRRQRQRARAAAKYQSRHPQNTAMVSAINPMRETGPEGVI